MSHKTKQVIKSFDASPDDIIKASLENWSLGSLQYYLAQGFELPFDAETVNKTLYDLANSLIHFPQPPKPHTHTRTHTTTK